MSWLLLLILSSMPAHADSPHRRQILVGKHEVVTFKIGKQTTAVRISDGDRVQSLVDTDGDGSFDWREFSSSDQVVRYSGPANNRRMETTRRTQKGFLRALYARERGGFRLIFRTLEPFRSLSMDAEGELTAEEAYCLSRAPAATFPLSADLIGRIQRAGRESPAAKILGASCRKNPFAAEAAYAEKGMEDILRSREAGGQNYVACLQKRGFSRIANSLDQALDAFVRNGETIECRATEDKRYGSFDTRTKKIFLHKRLSPLAASGEQCGHAYGDLIFHEALHRAGIESERLVHGLVACCGQSPGGDEKACQTAKQIVTNDDQRLGYLSALSSKMEGFGEFWLHLQSLGDSQAATSVFDDYTDRFRKYPELLAQLTAGCKGNASCLANTGTEAARRTQAYFEEECPRFFAHRADGGTACAKLGQEAVRMVQKNSVPGCRGKKESCLTLAMEAIGRGEIGRTVTTVVAESLRGPGAANERFMNSYLTAFTEVMDGVEDGWNLLKTAVDTPEAEGLAVRFLRELPQKGEAAGDAFRDCLKKGSGRAGAAMECGRVAHERIKAWTESFFAGSCQESFTQAERTRGICGKIHASMWGMIEKSVTGGCQMPPLEKESGLNLSCLQRGLEQGRTYFARYEKFPPSHWKNARGQNWFDASYREKRAAAESAARAPVVASEGGFGLASAETISFDAEDLDALKSVVAQSSPLTTEVLQRAASAVADASRVLVPEAQAAEPRAMAEGKPADRGANENTFSLADPNHLPTPESLPLTDPGAGIIAPRKSDRGDGASAGGAPRTSAGSLALAAPVERDREPRAVATPPASPVASRAMAGSFPQPPSAENFPSADLGGATAAPAFPPANGGSRLVARSRAATRSVAVKTNGGAAGQARSVSPAQFTGWETTASLRQYLLDNASAGLRLLGNSAFQQRLVSEGIRVIDATGLEFGSDRPLVRLRYDIGTQSFLDAGT